MWNGMVRKCFLEGLGSKELRGLGQAERGIHLLTVPHLIGSEAKIQIVAGHRLNQNHPCIFLHCGSSLLCHLR